MQMDPPLFIADVHLGKLARRLRMLGFDTAYSNAFSSTTLISIAEEQQRIILSRNAAIGRHHPLLTGFLIIHNEPERQLKEVLQHLCLLPQIKPFTRCMMCNALLRTVSKEVILHLLPEKTALYYHEFWQCTSCKRIYWKGPHYQRMLRFIEKIKVEILP